MKDQLRTDAPEPRPGLDRVRVTLSITPDEHRAWLKTAGDCGMKLTRWAPISLNRLVSGIVPIQPKTALPSQGKTGNVKP